MLAEALVAASMALAIWQDLKGRAIHDATWIPAGVGLGVLLYFDGRLFSVVALRLAILAAAALLALRFGAVGEADAICLAFLGATSSPTAPLPQLSVSGLLAGGHIIYLYGRGLAGKKLLIPLDRFLKEQQWIPKALVEPGGRRELTNDVNKAREDVEAASRAAGDGAKTMVEVEYGVPLAAYFGGGYLAALAIRLLTS